MSIKPRKNDTHRSPFRPATTAWAPRAPAAGANRSATAAGDVGVGYMMRSLSSAYKSDVPLIAAARRSWMVDAGPDLEVLLLVDCDRDHDEAPQLAPPPELRAGDGALPRLHLACYAPLANVVNDSTVEVTAILNNFDKFGALLSAMLRVMPRKRWYLKLDTDTVLVPENLLRFLSFFSMNARAPTNLYFGDAGELPQRSNRPVIARRPRNRRDTSCFL